MNTQSVTIVRDLNWLLSETTTDSRANWTFYMGVPQRRKLVFMIYDKHILHYLCC